MPPKSKPKAKPKGKKKLVINDKKYGKMTPATYKEAVKLGLPSYGYGELRYRVHSGNSEKALKKVLAKDPHQKKKQAEEDEDNKPIVFKKKPKAKPKAKPVSDKIYITPDKPHIKAEKKAKAKAEKAKAKAKAKPKADKPKAKPKNN